MKKDKTLYVNPSFKNATIPNNMNWDGWLVEFENNLKELGYNRFKQNYKGEDFSYWKTIKNREQAIYQIGLLFYDFRKLVNDKYSSHHTISVMYECMLASDNRIDMEVSKNIDIPEFELMAKSFYESMLPYLKKMN